MSTTKKTKHYSVAKIYLFSFRLKQTSETSIKSASDHTLSRYHPDESYEIRSLCVYSTGFMFGYLNGKVHIYEKDSINRYVKKCVIKINPEPKLVYEEQLEAQRATAINSISISPSNEVILVTCSLQQIYTAKMKWIEMNTETTFLEFGPSLHKGPVGDMAVCYWKSFLITSGSFPTQFSRLNPKQIKNQIQNNIFEYRLTGSYIKIMELRYTRINFATTLRR